MKNKEIIRCEKMSISFGGIKAVSGISLRLDQGQVVGIMGPNGAGKTTVFNLLTGVYGPTSGKIYVEGKDMAGKTMDQFVKAGVARTFQNIRLFENMTVLENIMAAVANKGDIQVNKCLLRTKKYIKRQNDIRSEALDLLKLFGLQGKGHILAGNLPYGQQRQLEIVRAIATGARAILLDEPAAGMNPTETIKLKCDIRDMVHRFGIGVMLIEHHMDLVMDLCDYIYVLDFGKVICEGRPREVQRDSKVISAYLG